MRHDVSDQADLSAIIARCDDSFANRRMTYEGGFNLRQFNPKPAQLHLLITPAGVFDLAIRVEPGPVTGTVKSRAGRVIEWMPDKFLGSHLGPVQISATNTRAADVEFAHRPDRARLLLFVENQNFRVGNRLANRDDSPAVNVRWNVIQRNYAGRFSLAEHMNMSRLMMELQSPCAWDVRLQRLTRRKHQSQFVIQQSLSRLIIEAREN